MWGQQPLCPMASSPLRASAAPPPARGALLPREAEGPAGRDAQATTLRALLVLVYPISTLNPPARLVSPKTNVHVIGNPEHVSEALRNGPVASSLLYASSSPIPFHRWDPEAEQGKRFSQSPTQPRASLALSDLFPVLAKSINLHLILQVSKVISHVTFIPPVSLKIGLSYYVS